MDGCLFPRTTFITYWIFCVTFSEKILSPAGEESEWQTIGFVSKSTCCDPCDQSNVGTKCGLVATPIPKSATLRVPGKTYHNRRWSQNRKVNKDNAISSDHRTTASGRPTRSLKPIKENTSNKPNIGKYRYFFNFLVIVIFLHLICAKIKSIRKRPIMVYLKGVQMSENIFLVVAPIFTLKIVINSFLCAPFI